MSRWRFINAAILMNFMAAARSEDIVGDNDEDDDEDIDRYLVRSNSDPGEKDQPFTKSVVPVHLTFMSRFKGDLSKMSLWSGSPKLVLFEPVHRKARKGQNCE